MVGGRDLIAQRQHGDAGLQAARAAEQMAGHGLGGADGELIGMIAEDALEREWFRCGRPLRWRCHAR